MAKPRSKITESSGQGQVSLKLILRVTFDYVRLRVVYLRIEDPEAQLGDILRPLVIEAGITLKEVDVRQGRRISLRTPFCDLRQTVVQFEGDAVEIADVSMERKRSLMKTAGHLPRPRGKLEKKRKGTPLELCPE